MLVLSLLYFFFVVCFLPFWWIKVIINLKLRPLVLYTLSWTCTRLQLSTQPLSVTVNVYRAWPIRARHSHRRLALAVAAVARTWQATARLSWQRHERSNLCRLITDCQSQCPVVLAGPGACQCQSPEHGDSWWWPASRTSFIALLLQPLTTWRRRPCGIVQPSSGELVSWGVVIRLCRRTYAVRVRQIVPHPRTGSSEALVAITVVLFRLECLSKFMLYYYTLYQNENSWLGVNILLKINNFCYP